MATRLVAASASPITPAASTGSRFSISSSQGCTRVGRVSGGCAGRASSAGSVNPSAMTLASVGQNDAIVDDAPGFGTLCTSHGVEERGNGGDLLRNEEHR